MLVHFFNTIKAYLIIARVLSGSLFLNIVYFFVLALSLFLVVNYF